MVFRSCWGFCQSVWTQQVGTSVPIHIKACRVRATTITHWIRQYSLWIKNTLSEWNDSHFFRTPGFYFKACRPCAHAESKPDALSRYFRESNARRAEIVNTIDDKKQHTQAEDIKTETKKQVRMTWAQRLRRVFDIDFKVCEACGGAVKIIACYLRSECYQSNPNTS